MSRRTGVEYYAVPANAIDYYCNRLSLMRQYASAAHLNGFFIESDELIYDTSGVLSDLSAWLELRKPLHADYSIFEHTGEFGHGDPLGNIRSGRIVRTRLHQEIRIPLALLTPGRDAYESCRRALTPLYPRRRSRKITPFRGEP